MPVPIYGFLEGDTIGLLILAEETDTAADLAKKLQDAAWLRVGARDNVQVVYKGKTLDPNVTLAQAGIEPLEKFDVVRG